jgi:hypothetical protein
VEGIGRGLFQDSIPSITGGTGEKRERAGFVSMSNYTSNSQGPEYEIQMLTNGTT